jgi:hypothetical protein
MLAMVGPITTLRLQHSPTSGQMNFYVNNCGDLRSLQLTARTLGCPNALFWRSVMGSLSAVSGAPTREDLPFGMRCIRALQIQRLEGSRPGGLWDLFLDKAVVVACEVAPAIGVLLFQLLVAERMVVGRHVREWGAHHHTAF